MGFVLTTFLAGVSFLGCEYNHGFITFPSLPDSFQWLRISTFGVFLAAAFLVSNFLIQKEFHRLRLDTRIADTVVILAIIGGVLGAKIAFLFETWNSWFGFDGMWDRFFFGRRPYMVWWFYFSYFNDCLLSEQKNKIVYHCDG